MYRFTWIIHEKRKWEVSPVTADEYVTFTSKNCTHLYSCNCTRAVVLIMYGWDF